MYISKDPIGLAGNNPNLYGYVYNPNTQADVFGLNILDEAWKIVTENINNSKTTTVLGHYPNSKLGETFESYIDKAKRKGANYFDMGNEMWGKVSDVTDPWVLNERFLDVITKRGDDILLNVKKNEIRRGSYLEKEIKFLEDNGYKWKNQWSLKKMCK